MKDHFALLGETRKPWLDSSVLQAKFVALSANIHPDRVHEKTETERQQAQEQFTALNTAVSTLREPKDRLLHLLELETGRKPAEVQDIPQDLMDLFFEVGSLCRQLDGVLAGKAAVDSPLLKVQWFEESQTWVEKTQAVLQKVNARRDALLDELRRMNPIWESAPPVGDPARLAALPIERLQTIYQLLSYYSRWVAQLQERFVQLSMP